MASCSRHKPAPVIDARYKNNNSAQPLSKQNKYDARYLTVNKGDTLYSIGFSHNLDYKYLARINNIPVPYTIYPGQKLRLKANKASFKNSTVQTHPVSPKKVHKNRNLKTKNNITKKHLPVKKQVQIATVNPKPTNKPEVKTKPVLSPTVTPNANSKWVWPVKGKIISTFSASDELRKGINISTNIGKPVHASNHGVVVYSGDGLLGYGELVIIKHSNNLLSAYAHNSSRLVKEGVKVAQGQVIAKSGKGSNGVGLLHFEIRKNGKPVNPLNYLSKK